MPIRSAALVRLAAHARGRSRHRRRATALTPNAFAHDKRAAWTAGEQYAFIIHAAEWRRRPRLDDLQPRGQSRGNVAYGVLAENRRKRRGPRAASPWHLDMPSTSCAGRVSRSASARSNATAEARPAVRLGDLWPASQLSPVCVRPYDRSSTCPIPGGRPEHSSATLPVQPDDATPPLSVERRHVLCFSGLLAWMYELPREVRSSSGSLRYRDLPSTTPRCRASTSFARGIACLSPVTSPKFVSGHLRRARGSRQSNVLWRDTEGSSMRRSAYRSRPR